MPPTLTQVNTEINAVLTSNDVSHWLKQALTEAISRDCVDVAHDAEILAQLLSQRCDAMLRRG